MEIDEEWLRAHLPQEYRDDPIKGFSGMYLNGLTVMHEGERGNSDVVVYHAENKNDLLYWELETVCMFLKEKRPSAKKIWRYYRDHAENGKWFYIERRHYDYNAIEDSRLYGFECFLKAARYGLPRERWEKRVEERIRLMNRWFTAPHWDYDRNALCFVEISDSREYDNATEIIEEPRPGSIVKIID